MHRYFTILRAQNHPLKFLISRLLMRTGLSTLMFIPQGGFRLRFFPSSLSASLWIDPEDRKDDVAFLDDYLREGDNVVDVGANIGSLSIASALRVGRGQVLALEPHPRIFGYLQGNLALNGVSNVTPVNMALGDAIGELWFSDERSDDQNSVAQEGEGIRVPVTTLDKAASEFGRISLLKIDVEGFEVAVLSGAAEVLRRTECVYCESYESHFQKLGWTTGDLIQKFEEAGMQVFSGIKQRLLTRVRPGYVSEECEDLVALHEPLAILRRMKCVFG